MSKLGNLLPIGSRDELVAYATHRELTEVREERIKVEAIDRKVDWAHAEVLAALAGKGTEACPYCATLAQRLKTAGLPLPTGVVLEWDLPTPDRGGKFQGGNGVRTNKDHIALHLNRAADALFAERQSRKAARELRLALKTGGNNHQAMATKSERRSRDSESKRARRERDRQRAIEMGCGRKKK